MQVLKRCHLTISSTFSALFAAALLGGCASAPVTNGGASTPVQLSVASRAMDLGEDASDAASTDYRETLSFELQREWRSGYRVFAADKSLGAEANLTVAFSVDAQGKLLDAKITRGSGSTMADYAVLMALRKAAPFSAFSPELRSRADVVRITRIWYVRSLHPWFAHDKWRPGERNLAAAQRLLDARNTEQRFTHALMERVQTGLARSPERAASTAKAMQNLDIKQIVAGMRDVYAAYLSPAECDSLAQFLATSVGEKFMGLDAAATNVARAQQRFTRAEAAELKAFLSSRAGQVTIKYANAMLGEMTLATQKIVIDAIARTLAEEEQAKKSKNTAL